MSDSDFFMCILGVLWLGSRLDTTPDKPYVPRTDDPNGTKAIVQAVCLLLVVCVPALGLLVWTFISMLGGR